MKPGEKTKSPRSREGFCLKLARPEGFEPPTPKFVAWCSIQLSYGRLEAKLCGVIAASSSPLMPLRITLH